MAPLIVFILIVGLFVGFLFGHREMAKDYLRELDQHLYWCDRYMALANRCADKAKRGTK